MKHQKTTFSLGTLGVIRVNQTFSWASLAKGITISVEIRRPRRKGDFPYFFSPTSFMG
jgi:hypothetical protein